MENRFFLLRIFYIKLLTQDTIDLNQQKISIFHRLPKKCTQFVIIVLLKPSIFIVSFVKSVKFKKKKINPIDPRTIAILD